MAETDSCPFVLLPPLLSLPLRNIAFSLCCTAALAHSAAVTPLYTLLSLEALSLVSVTCRVVVDGRLRHASGPRAVPLLSARTSACSTDRRTSPSLVAFLALCSRFQASNQRTIFKASFSLVLTVSPPRLQQRATHPQEQLASGIDGLVLPGGESTTMGLVAERSGILPQLRETVKAVPVFVRLT